jgi:predicted transposase YbfD/YdcC
MVSIEGAVVAIDAIGCQREIARKIVDKTADTVLALKGDQGALRDDVELFATSRKPRVSPIRQSASIKPSTATTAGSKPGMSRSFTTSPGCENGANGRASGASSSSKPCAKSDPGPRNRTQDRTRNPLLPDLFAAARRQTRTHRTRSLAVENGLSWVMAMTFRDDECRIRTENAPENGGTLKHISVNLARRDKRPKTPSASLSKPPHRTTTFSPT